MTEARASSGARRPRPFVRLALALALAAPFVVVPIALRRVASFAASALGAHASRAASALAPPPTEPESTADPARAIGEIAPVSFVYPALASDAAASAFFVRDAATRREHRAKRKPARRGLLVRAATVERAIRMGGRPSGAPVPASGMRPAGLALAGVSRYGSALRDGDVLTKVGGTAATSEGAVIGAVAGAIRSGAHVVTGVIWRGQDRYDVAVEIPRIAKPRDAKR